MQTIVLFTISNLLDLADFKNMILKTELKLFAFVDMRSLLSFMHPSRSQSLSMVLIYKIRIKTLNIDPCNTEFLPNNTSHNQFFDNVGIVISDNRNFP